MLYLPAAQKPTPVTRAKIEDSIQLYSDTVLVAVAQVLTSSKEFPQCLRRRTNAYRSISRHPVGNVGDDALSVDLIIS